MGLTFYSYGRDSQLPMGLLLFARVRTNNQYSLEPSIHPNTVDILLSTAKKAVFIANQKILKMSPLLEDSELGKPSKMDALQNNSQRSWNERIIWQWGRSSLGAQTAREFPSDLVKVKKLVCPLHMNCAKKTSAHKSQCKSMRKGIHLIQRVFCKVTTV